jgi:hypothetical protein
MLVRQAIRLPAAGPNSPREQANRLLLEFLHFSGSGTADELFLRDLDLEFVQKFRVFDYFLP